MASLRGTRQEKLRKQEGFTAFEKVMGAPRKAVVKDSSCGLCRPYRRPRGGLEVSKGSLDMLR